MQEPLAIIPPTNVPVAQRMSPRRARLVIFATAPVLRPAAGAVFLGSVDLIHSALNSIAVSQGRPVNLPYFPTLDVVIWFGGVLAATSPVPLALVFEFVPILFDSLLAVLIFDLVSRSPSCSSPVSVANGSQSFSVSCCLLSQSARAIAGRSGANSSSAHYLASVFWPNRLHCCLWRFPPAKGRCRAAAARLNC
jgi:hypothetical protein